MNSLHLSETVNFIFKDPGGQSNKKRTKLQLFIAKSLKINTFILPEGVDATQMFSKSICQKHTLFTLFLLSNQLAGLSLQATVYHMDNEHCVETLTMAGNGCFDIVYKHDKNKVHKKLVLRWKHYTKIYKIIITQKT